MQTYDHFNKYVTLLKILHVLLNLVFYCTSITHEFYVCIKPNTRASAKMTLLHKFKVLSLTKKP